jgi:ribose-phosphate pyrophosphokinase
MALSVLALPGNEPTADALARALGGDRPRLETRRFPDEETYLRIHDFVERSDAVVVATLDRPDPKFFPLIALAGALRELGARRVGLVAPYLAYLRQDARFHPGEAVSSRTLGRALSTSFDWLVTVDPHLHRHLSLDEVLQIPSRIVPAAPRVADWIDANVKDPLIVGPDVESGQWAGEVARIAGAPHVVGEKTRRGDRDVGVALPDVAAHRGRTAVVVDDIVSTASTMVETLKALHSAGFASPVCVGVHAIFAGHALSDLTAAGAGRVVTCDTVPHPTNAIALADDLATAVAGM